MLQDRHGIDINLLLYAGWRAWSGDALSHQGCLSAMERSESWRDDLVRPLRAVRRSAGALASSDPSFARAYALLKACELQLERQQQAMLADGSIHDSGAEADIATALEVFAGSVGILDDGDVRPALATIAAAMEAVAR